MWATAQEVADRFVATTLSDLEAQDIGRVGFTFRTLAQGVMDDGVQFVSLAHVEVKDGAVVVGEPVEFCHYQAFEDAGSYIAAAFECVAFSMEERLGPFGIEWEREQHERGGVAA
jgi:hypothetical protein